MTDMIYLPNNMKLRGNGLQVLVEHQGKLNYMKPINGDYILVQCQEV